MNYHGLQRGSLSNGEGVRTVLWVAGCNHHCKCCQNPDTWNPNGGELFDEVAKEKLFNAVGRKWCDGVTFSGGDPLHPNNRETITALAKELKERFPDKTIWLYTGFLFEEIEDLEVLKYVDVVVDGKFMEEFESQDYKYAGSTNQRVVDVKGELEKMKGDKE